MLRVFHFKVVFADGVNENSRVLRVVYGVPSRRAACSSNSVFVEENHGCHRRLRRLRRGRLESVELSVHNFWVCCSFRRTLHVETHQRRQVNSILGFEIVGNWG